MAVFLWLQKRKTREIDRHLTPKSAIEDSSVYTDTDQWSYISYLETHTSCGRFNLISVCQENVLCLVQLILTRSPINKVKDMFMIVKLTSLKNDNSGIIYAQPEKDCFFCGRKNIFCVTFPFFLSIQLKSLGSKSTFDPIDLHWMEKNILFCVSFVESQDWNEWGNNRNSFLGELCLIIFSFGTITLEM